MKSIVSTAAVVIGLALPATAGDYSQLAASVGIDASTASTLSLTEIAAAKFSADGGQDADQIVSKPGVVMVDPVRHAQLIAAADLTPAEARGLTLTELAAGKFNADASADEAQTARAVTMSTRGPVAIVPAQLAAAADLTPAEARGMSLNEIYVAKINAEARGDDRQGRY